MFSSDFEEKQLLFAKAKSIFLKYAILPFDLKMRTAVGYCEFLFTVRSVAVS